MSWLEKVKLINRGRQIKTVLAGQHGQIVVEYILLLIIAVTIALVITTTLVSRNEESPGFMIKKWRQIIDAIGADD